MVQEPREQAEEEQASKATVEQEAAASGQVVLAMIVIHMFPLSQVAYTAQMSLRSPAITVESLAIINCIGQREAFHIVRTVLAQPYPCHHPHRSRRDKVRRQALVVVVVPRRLVEACLH